MQVERYIFFPACAERFGLLSPGLLAESRDEDVEQGMLHSALQILEEASPMTPQALCSFHNQCNLMPYSCRKLTGQKICQSCQCKCSLQAKHSLTASRGSLAQCRPIRIVGCCSSAAGFMPARRCTGESLRQTRRQARMCGCISSQCAPAYCRACTWCSATSFPRTTPSHNPTPCGSLQSRFGYSGLLNCNSYN
jgi:hypothetical protein